MRAHLAWLTGLAAAVIIGGASLWLGATHPNLRFVDYAWMPGQLACLGIAVAVAGGVMIATRGEEVGVCVGLLVGLCLGVVTASTVLLGLGLGVGVGAAVGWLVHLHQQNGDERAIRRRAAAKYRAEAEHFEQVAGDKLQALHRTKEMKLLTRAMLSQLEGSARTLAARAESDRLHETHQMAARLIGAVTQLESDVDWMVVEAAELLARSAHARHLAEQLEDEHLPAPEPEPRWLGSGR